MSNALHGDEKTNAMPWAVGKLFRDKPVCATEAINSSRHCIRNCETPSAFVGAKWSQKKFEKNNLLSL